MQPFITKNHSSSNEGSEKTPESIEKQSEHQSQNVDQKCSHAL